MPNHHVITSIELEQFLDRLEAQLQQPDNDPADVLAALREQPLRADSIASINRLFILWVNAGDSQAAWPVLINDGDALLESLPEARRDETRMHLSLFRLRLGGHLDQYEIVLETLEVLQRMAATPLDFDVEHYRQSRVFTDLEQAPLQVALKVVEVSWRLARNYRSAALQAWDEADMQQRRARVLARHGQAEQAQEAALQAIAVMRDAAPDQDIDVNDWLWLGNAVIEIIPQHLAMFEQPVTEQTTHLPQPQRREWEVRMARLQARALHAQGHIDQALEHCSVASHSLESDGDNNFIAFELPWLVEAGRMAAAGQRAFEDIYEMRREMWAGTAYWVAQRLQDPQDSSVWWPLCVMRACDDASVLEVFISGLPDASVFDRELHPLLVALYQVSDCEQALPEIFALACEEAQCRAPENPWILRLVVVREAKLGLIDSATYLARVTQAVTAGQLNESRSAFSLFDARVDVLGVVAALGEPRLPFRSGWDAYNYAGSIDGRVEKLAESMDQSSSAQVIALLRSVQKEVYEQGVASMERYFATGSGHRYDSCAHLYSMMCNNLAINYCYYNDQQRYHDAIELHRRGIEASPFAEHYDGLLSNRIRLKDQAGLIEAAERLWHYSAEYGYSRHDPDKYVVDVARALNDLGRENEILIWLEQVLELQAQQQIADSELGNWSLNVRIKLARNFVHSHPEQAMAVLARYESCIAVSESVGVQFDSACIFDEVGQPEQALLLYRRALALLDPQDPTYAEDKVLIERNINTVQSLDASVPESDAQRKWWQIWK